MATPYRSIRETTGLSLREVARRAGFANPARLSIIERGVEPTPEEHQAIMAVLLKAVSEPKVVA
jgi:transcriptional regulator with XRE-family HTH domain